MGIEQRAVAAKQRSIRRGDPVAAVFTGDEEGIDCDAAR
jgi:hypothetical protein